MIADQSEGVLPFKAAAAFLRARCPRRALCSVSDEQMAMNWIHPRSDSRLHGHVELARTSMLGLEVEPTIAVERRGGGSGRTKACGRRRLGLAADVGTSRHRGGTEPGPHIVELPRRGWRYATPLGGPYDLSRALAGPTAPRSRSTGRARCRLISGGLFISGCSISPAPSRGGARSWPFHSRRGGSVLRSSPSERRIRRNRRVEVETFRSTPVKTHLGKTDPSSDGCARIGNRRRPRSDGRWNRGPRMSRRRKDARGFEQEAMSLGDFAVVMGLDVDTVRKHAVVVPNGERAQPLPPGKFPCRRIGTVKRVLLSEVLGVAEPETNELDGPNHRPTAEGAEEGDGWRGPLAGLRPSRRS